LLYVRLPPGNGWSWSAEIDAICDLVIQGHYWDYIVNGLFETDFLYDSLMKMEIVP